MAQPAGLPGSPLTAEKSSLRNATNLRTVSRNDPAVAEILDTSTYSVIYHYDADAGKWQKQKQEGSLFVVRRTKAPEYALFMLNRVTVKNVTIPLIPGEMKASAIDASMLQVARRGEKIKYGIWFTEGTDGVQRFRDTIVRVCGEPSKTGASTSVSAPASAPAAAPTANIGVTSTAPSTAGPTDDLSRLFASISTVPARSSKHASASPQPYQAAPAQAPLPQQQSQPQQQQQQSPAPYGALPAGYPGMPDGAGQHPPNSLFPSAPAPPPPQPPLPAPPAYAPGQTVDDLLMSILGPPVAPQPAAMHVGLGSYSPMPLVAGSPLGGPPPSPPPPGSMAHISGPCAPGPIANYCAPHPSSTAPPPVPGPPPSGPIQNRAPPLNGTASPSLHPPGSGIAPIRDAVARSIPSSSSSTPTPVAPAPPDFRAFLADLVTQPHNAWFVDQVFAAYTQNLERESKKQESRQQGGQKSQKQPDSNNNTNNGSATQSQGGQGQPRRGGNRPQRGRQQQQKS